MGFHPTGGVTEFIKLTDAPGGGAGSYAAQARKKPSVNAGETALEFVAGADQPINPTFDNTVIWNAAVPVVWTDLDCGVGAAIVYLKVTGAVEDYYFRPKGVSTSVHANGAGVAWVETAVAPRNGGYVCLPTDSTGKIQIRSVAGNAAIITRIGYWVNPPMPNTVIASGNSTNNAWTLLATGIPNALVFLMMDTTVAGFEWSLFKKVGETLEVNPVSYYGINSGCCQGTGGATMTHFALVMTDSFGNVYKKNSSIGSNMTITLLAYLPALSVTALAIYTGLDCSLTMSYSDVDTPFGRGYCYFAVRHTAGAGLLEVGFRVNGEVGNFYCNQPDGGATSTGPGNGEVAYMFVPLDVYGTCEWVMSIGAVETVDIIGEMVSKG